MSGVTVKRTINAPAAAVFKAITDVENSPSVSPEVVRVEFLTEQRTGAGTRFRETRASKGKETVTELEITEFVENSRARFVTDAGGTVWDTVFTVREMGSEAGPRSELEIALDARPHRFFAKLITPLIMGMVRRGIEGHMDSLRDHCERA